MTTVKRGRGRPSSFAEHADKIILGVAHGFDVREVCRAIGIPHGRVDIWAQRNPDFHAAVHAAREIAATERAARLAQLFPQRPTAAAKSNAEPTAALSI